MSNATNNLGEHQQDRDMSMLHTVAAVYLGLLAALGSVGNSLVVSTVVRMTQMHRSTYILVGNLSVVGLLTCLLTIPLHVAHTLLDPSLWGGRGVVLCKIQAHINFSLMLSLLANSAAIAVCRYRAVYATHNVRGQTESKRAIVKLIFFSWALPALVGLSASPFLGFNSLVSDCFFQDVDHSFWYMNLALALPALLSTACKLVIYALIIKKVRDSHLKISNFRHASQVKDEGRDSKCGGRAGSESEVQQSVIKNEGSSQGPSQSGDINTGTNNAGITVYTTMVQDTYIHTPSTSYAPGVKPTLATFKPTQKSTTLIVKPTPTASQTAVTMTLTESQAPVSVLSFAQTQPNKQSSNFLQPPKTKASLALSDESSGSYVEGVSTISALSENSSAMSSSRPEDVTDKKKKGRGRKQMKKEVNLTLHLFLAFVLFCVCYLPLCLAHVVHFFHALTKEIWLVFYTLALSFASNAWLVYALLNKEFRRAFRALLNGRRSF